MTHSQRPSQSMLVGCPHSETYRFTCGFELCSTCGEVLAFPQERGKSEALVAYDLGLLHGRGLAMRGLLWPSKDGDRE